MISTHPINRTPLSLIAPLSLRGAHVKAISPIKIVIQRSGLYAISANGVRAPGRVLPPAGVSCEPNPGLPTDVVREVPCISDGLGENACISAGAASEALRQTPGVLGSG